MCIRLQGQYKITWLILYFVCTGQVNIQPIQDSGMSLIGMFTIKTELLSAQLVLPRTQKTHKCDICT
jgi:hypothetical protein